VFKISENKQPYSCTRWLRARRLLCMFYDNSAVPGVGSPAGAPTHGRTFTTDNYERGRQIQSASRNRTQPDSDFYTSARRSVRVLGIRSRTIIPANARISASDKSRGRLADDLHRGGSSPSRISSNVRDSEKRLRSNSYRSRFSLTRRCAVRFITTNLHFTRIRYTHAKVIKPVQT